MRNPHLHTIEVFYLNNSPYGQCIVWTCQLLRSVLRGNSKVDHCLCITGMEKYVDSVDLDLTSIFLSDICPISLFSDYRLHFKCHLSQFPLFFNRCSFCGHQFPRTFSFSISSICHCLWADIIAQTWYNFCLLLCNHRCHSPAKFVPYCFCRMKVKLHDTIMMAIIPGALLQGPLFHHSIRYY